MTDEIHIKKEPTKGTISQKNQPDGQDLSKKEITSPSRNLKKTTKKRRGFFPPHPQADNIIDQTIDAIADKLSELNRACFSPDIKRQLEAEEALEEFDEFINRPQKTILPDEETEEEEEYEEEKEEREKHPKQFQPPDILDKRTLPAPKKKKIRL